MEVEIEKLGINKNSTFIRPEFGLKITFPIMESYPLYISGVLKSTDERILCDLNECQLNYKESKLDIIGKELIDNGANKINTKQNSSLYVILTGNLNSLGANHIEVLRDKTTDKSVKFKLEVLIKSSIIPEKGPYSGALRFLTKKYYLYHSVNQELWIKGYSEAFKLGKYLLVELPNNQIISENEEWLRLSEMLVQDLNRMQTYIKSGDWQSVMRYGRDFYENLKLGDGKKGNERFRIEFEKLLKPDNHDKPGIQSIYDSIWQMFLFLSKFNHPRNNDGFLKPIPTAHKEDAYLVYSLALNLYNFLTQKINRASRNAH